MLDTHPLVWFILNDQARLSDAADALLRKAEQWRPAAGGADFTIRIPTIVLAEAIYVGEKNKLGLSVERLQTFARNIPAFRVVDLDMTVLSRWRGLRHGWKCMTASLPPPQWRIARS